MNCNYCFIKTRIMKNLKSIIVAFILLIGFNSNAQEIKNPTVEIALNGQVWYMQESAFLASEWMRNDKQMLEMMHLKLYKADSEELYFSKFQSDQIGADAVILAVPFLSCGIGHDYYQLIQTNDNFLLFESIARNKYETDKRVMVMNKRK